MSSREKLIEGVAHLLESREELPNEETLFRLTRGLAEMQELLGNHYNEEDIRIVVQELQSRYEQEMDLGVIFDVPYTPWLAGRKGTIEWYYWNRFVKFLKIRRGFAPRVVNSMSTSTDRILDRLEDPDKEGAWARRGMVVGHVQSGKTSNYTGLVCKAADAGYKVIIVLAGMLNALRNQTQERLESDFMGWCTRESKPIGVAQYSKKPLRRPISLTRKTGDFDKHSANQVSFNLNSISEPVVFVVKKNKTTLTQLYRWLSDNNREGLRNHSMLMIDDEADHASVNTSNSDTDPTAINMAIRDLLSLFSRSAYIGYTATPFANIFIDPDSSHEMANHEYYQDLFPRHFILSLDPPNNYIGPNRIFSDDTNGGKLDCVRIIADNEDLLPVRHQIDFEPAFLPESLKEAINCFILARAIRLIRHQQNQHHSMMINVSRFTRVQNLLRGLVYQHVNEIIESVKLYSALPEDKALRNSTINRLRTTWKREYGHISAWGQIQLFLTEAAGSIEVLSINSVSDDVLDYGRRNYPNGRTLIAIGGLNLSRGLTLEGLMVSYFLRNSVMYDTLMQMGRWFGYRPGYDDLCRIFMTASAESWYSHITESVEELREDFRIMAQANLTPMDFGLRVRSHPTALIVTARNKMRSGRNVPVNLSYAGKLAETSVLHSEEDILLNNRKVLTGVVSRVQAEGIVSERINLGFLFRNAPVSIVITALENYVNHPASLRSYPEPLIAYLGKMSENGMDKCDVLLSSLRESENPIEIAGLTINPPQRSIKNTCDGMIEFKKRRVASRGDESAGLPEDVVKHIKDRYENRYVPDKEYRKYRMENNLPPLFMLQFVRPIDADDQFNVVSCFGLSFPGDPESSFHDENTVEYIVNRTWWREHFLNDDDEEEI